MAVVCELCLTRSTNQPYRAAGLDICKVCWTGNLADALDAWGFQMEAEHKTEWVKSGDNQVLRQRATIAITLKKPCPVTVEFSRQQPVPKWLQWLGFKNDDPEVGDPLFDDYVEVRAHAGDAIALLSSEGLQTGISSITADGGRVSIKHRDLNIRQSWGESEMPDHGEVNCRAVAIAVHLERYTRGLT